MAKKNKKRTLAKAMASAKREAMKKAGFLDGRFSTRTADSTPKQKIKKDRRNIKKELNNLSRPYST